MKPLVIALFLLGFAACKSDERKVNDIAYAQQKESLASSEKEKPLAFLKIKGDDRKNLIGQTVVRGVITNAATVCSYKDIRVKMLCYNKAGNMVEEHEDIINDVIKPNSDKDFKTRYRLPKGTDSIALSIMSAVVVK